MDAIVCGGCEGGCGIAAEEEGGILNNSSYPN